MPDPSKYKDKKSFMKDCVPEAMKEPDTTGIDHAIAKCNGMWKQHQKKKKGSALLELIRQRFFK